MNIWQIQQDLLSIFDELEENGGELTEELEEKLAISKENFKSKVEGYVNVIKQVKSDIAAIDQESKRLAELKKSKNAVIERLTKVLVPAIQNFGDVSKSGSAFVDYGTGKVSIRSTQKVELDDDKLDTISSEFNRALSFEAMMGAGSNRESFTFEDIIQRCKEHKSLNPIDGGLEDDSQNVTEEDIQNTVVDITFKSHIIDLMKGEGFNLMKQLIMYNQSVSMLPKIDKTQLKNELSSCENITIGKIVDNKTLTIK